MLGRWLGGAVVTKGTRLGTASLKYFDPLEVEPLLG